MICRTATPFAWALALSLAAPGACRAASLEVVPTLIEVPSTGGMTQLRLVNRDTKPADVQIESFAWRQNGGERLEDSDEIVLSPPLARLKPLSSQIVRLFVSPSNAAAERAFRILVTQLPDGTGSQAGARVLLQFSVPLFAGDGRAKGPRVTWALRRDGPRLRLDARNAGASRAKFSGLELAGPNGAHARISPVSLTYVLAGATRSWIVSEPGLQGALRLEGNDEAAHDRISLPLEISD